MTSPRDPTTEAGRQFNEQTDGQYIEDVLAIESEARATAPAGLDRERLAYAFHSQFCSPHGHDSRYDLPIIEKVAAEYDRLAAADRMDEVVGAS